MSDRRPSSHAALRKSPVLVIYLTSESPPRSEADRYFFTSAPGGTSALISWPLVPL
jgi:hypothetical protein